MKNLKSGTVESKSKNLKIKIYTTGYYINKHGKRSYGFVKRDARKKQTTWIKDLSNLETYRITDRLNKEEFKKFKKKIKRYIEKGYKTILGKKIEYVERVIKEITFPVSKSFDLKYDKGNYTRVETLFKETDVLLLQNAFFSIFTYGKKINAEFVVPSFKIEVDFKHRKNYSYEVDYFIFSRRYFTDLEVDETKKQWQNIVTNFTDAIKSIRENYKPKKLKFTMKVQWLIKK